MDPKELKAALKSAREAIRGKEYKEALKHCKGILKHDKNNYNALVFVGVAAEGLEQPDQAIMAYKKATDISPEQALAWQGLVGFFEKSGNPQYNEDLMQAYVKIRCLLKSDVEKSLDTTRKMLQLYRTMGAVDRAVGMLQELVSGDLGEEHKMEFWAQMVQMLEAKASLSEEEDALLTQGYRKMLQTPPADLAIHAIIVKYINKLSKTQLKLGEDPVPEIQSLSERFPDDPYPLEVLCQAYLQTHFCGSAPNQLRQITSSLSKLDPENSMLALSKGYKTLNEGDITEAKAMITKAVQDLPSSVVGLAILGELYLKLHERRNVLAAIKKCTALLVNGDTMFFGEKNLMSTRLDLMTSAVYIESHSTSQHEKAVSLCKTILAGPYSAFHDKANVNIGYAYVLLGNSEEIAKLPEVLAGCPSGPDMSALQAWIHFYHGDFPAAQSQLEKALTAAENHGRYLYLMARVYRELGKDNDDYNDKCFNTLMRAAKADPCYSPTFLHLGGYYQAVVNDLGKARRCYQKSYQLDPEHEEAGCRLADALKTAGEADALFGILRSVTSKARPGEAKWAWLRLGLHQMHHGDPTEAITSLQSALRADITDRHCWECLGEAYLKRGSYTAALKAFTRTTELDPGALYCHYQIAYIKQQLGEYTAAREAYEGIVRTTPGYVPALKGVGETNLLLARHVMKDYFHGRVVTHCEVAIEALAKAASSRPDISTLWKLLGDACALLYTVPADLARLKVHPKLLSQTTTDGDQMVELGKKDVLSLASRCFGMAVKQLPECSSLWHDLGVSYYYQAKCADKVSAKTLYGKSIQALQKAISVEPANHRHWNALGVVATSEDVDHSGLAQHAFIKSIESEANNVVAWTNLGTLYFINSDVELAHEALKVAQSLEPAYVAAWIGQALIAETVCHDDAMDLFRHTTELGMHVEGATGYAQWVCNTLLDSEKMNSSMFQYAIEQMAAVPAASDALAKYTDRIRDDPIALNLYGLLLERQKLFSMAAKAFAGAMSLVEKGGTPEETRAVRENYARLLCKTDQYQEAIVQYETLEATKDFNLCVGLALARYKSGAIAESYATYENALTLADTAERKSQVFAAMGMLAYGVNDLEGAKTALFSCSQLSPPSPAGLSALMALGLLHGEVPLAAAVHQELLKQELDTGLQSAVEKLTLCLEARLSGDSSSVSSASLAKAVHRNPQNADVWFHLAATLSRNGGKYTTAASCAQSARLVQQEYTHSPEWSSLESLSMLASGLHIKGGVRRNAFTAAQRTLLLYPDALSSWCGLLSAAQAQYHLVTPEKQTRLQGVIISLATHIMARVEAELTSMVGGDKGRLQAVHLWSVKQYVLALLLAGRQEQALKFLQSAAWLYEGDLDLQSLVAALGQNFGALKEVSAADGSGLGWQLLISLYLSHGLLAEVEKSYHAWLENTTDVPQKTLVCAKLCFHLYKLVMSSSDVTSDAFHKVAGQALTLSPSCVPVLLMQGLVYMKEKNARFSRRSFQLVVQNKCETVQPRAVCMARKHLLRIYMTKNDEDNIQSLVHDARESCDAEFLQYYEDTKNASE